jgi:hypothetical protein
VAGLKRWHLLLGLVALAYLGLRLAAFLPAATRRYPDSGTYLHVAAQSPWSVDFLAGWRPVTVPFFYKVLPDGDGWRTGGQLLVSVASWLALAGAVAWNVRQRALRIAAFAAILLFSLSPVIGQWDLIVLSDSLSVSLAAATLAAWLVLARRPSWLSVGLVLAVSLAFSFVRDTDAYLSLMAVPFVLAWAAVRRPRALPLVLAAGLVAICVASLVAQSSGTAAPRREGVLFNVIGERVLPDREALDFFRQHGMPLPEPVRQAGRGLGPAMRPDRPLARDPRVQRFKGWVSNHGRQVLARYLATHPGRALEPVVEESEQLFEGREESALVGYRTRGFDQLLPGAAQSIVYPSSALALLAWAAVAIVAAAWLLRLGRGRAVWLVPAATVLLQIPHAAIVWHGDINEIPRHALLVGVLTRLGLLMLTIFLIDAALERRASAKQGS